MIDLKLQKLPGKALCAESDPEHWFPKGEQNVVQGVEERERAAQAKEVCRRCTVRVACLQEAMENKIDHGIWGGLTVKERKKLRKAQK
jgi:WhiB family transcriptional regulator, redox-sensing transcriptional regulator